MTNERQLKQGSWLANNRRAALVVTVVPYLLLAFLERLPGTFAPPLMYFVAAGVWALYVTPRLLKRRLQAGGSTGHRPCAPVEAGCMA